MRWRLKPQLSLSIQKYNKQKNTNFNTDSIDDILDFIEHEQDLTVNTKKKFALHKSESKSNVRILAVCSVKVISHMARIKANLTQEGNEYDWFSKIGQTQEFVLLGPRSQENLPTVVEGSFGCRAALQGLASLTVQNTVH